MQNLDDSLMNLANFKFEQGLQNIELSSESSQTQITNAANIRRSHVLLKTREELLSRTLGEISATEKFGYFDPNTQDRLTFITKETADLLEKEGRRLQDALLRTVESIMIIMKNNNILYEKYVDVARDIESPSWIALKVQVTVFKKDFDEMLTIWSSLCKDVYSKLDKENAKKIYIIMKQV